MGADMRIMGSFIRMNLSTCAKIRENTRKMKAVHSYVIYWKNSAKHQGRIGPLSIFYLL